MTVQPKTRRAGVSGARRWVAAWLGSIRDDAAADVAGGRLFLWSPVAIGVGSAAYVSLPFEPAVETAVLLPPLALGVVLTFRRLVPALVLPLTALSLVLLGVSLARLHVERAAAPRIEIERSHQISGWILSVEDREARGHRLLIAPVAMDPEPSGGLPHRIRVTVRGLGEPPVPGSAVHLRTRLSPPQSPLIPGGWDFARVAWFQRVGAVGYGLGTPEIWTDAPPPSREVVAVAAVERFRQAVSTRIRAALPGEAGAIAAALVVGDRGAIDPDTDEAMRISGLSHVLSISGLHMGLVALSLFAGGRLLFAAVPPLVLLLPARKIAAAVALAGVAAYMVVSGLSIPAQRAAIMSGVALLAVILDRRALSLRTVAVAALVILVLEPQAALDAGAQMSFAAVTALVAGFEVLAARRPAVPDSGDLNPAVRAVSAAMRWIGASLITSLVAGLATTPIAVHHFGRLAPLGLVANLLATPVITFAIMPFAVITMLAMPLGLESIPLAVMGAGIDAMIVIARWTAALTPAGGLVGRPWPPGTLLVVFGGLWLCLWSRRARLPGLPLVLAGLVLMPLRTTPDLVVSADGTRALLATASGARIVGRGGAFETRLWLQAIGHPLDPTDPALSEGTVCDPEACILLDAEGRTLIAVIRHPIAFGDECRRAPLVITPLDAPDWCRAATTVLDASDVARTGAATYRIHTPADGEGGRLRLDLIEAARSGAPRPWSGKP